MLDILALEDNLEERKFLCNCIKAILTDCQIHEAQEASCAMNLCEKIKMDILFIDVELPGMMNGFQFAKQLRQTQYYAVTPIIFTTGKRVNQLEIHKRYHHYEYLCKPFDREEFCHAVGFMLKSLDADPQRKNTSQKQRLISIQYGKVALFVPISDILFVESSSRTLKVWIKNNQMYETHCKLSVFISQTIQNPYFVQCHKSFALNIENVRELIPDGRGIWRIRFTEETRQSCYVSKTYYYSVNNKLLQYVKGSEPI